jgi:hypothetical protein
MDTFARTRKERGFRRKKRRLRARARLLFAPPLSSRLRVRVVQLERACGARACVPFPHSIRTTAQSVINLHVCLAAHHCVHDVMYAHHCAAGGRGRIAADAVHSHVF